jgi:hypothetical protein
VNTYAFNVVLADVTDFDDAAADALFDAGCDDGSLTARDDRVWVSFVREAASPRAALVSAIRDVQSAGFTVDAVESGLLDEYGTADDELTTINAALALRRVPDHELLDLLHQLQAV